MKLKKQIKYIFKSVKKKQLIYLTLILDISIMIWILIELASLSIDTMIIILVIINTVIIMYYYYYNPNNKKEVKES